MGVLPSVLEQEPNDYLETLCHLAIHRYDDTKG